MPTVRSVKFTANRIPTFIRTSADHVIILVTPDTLSGTQRISDDNADQLIQAPLKNANNNTLITQYTYGYDLAANRTSELIGSTTTTSTPNNVNEITSQSGGTNRTLYYDYNGSMVNDGLTRTFEWDAANRLVAVNIGTNRSEFTYDGLSRCVKIVEKTNGSVTSTRKFVWCGNEKCEFRDGNDVVTLFAYPQGQYANNTKYFYFRDHLGSIREMMRANGTLVARFDYDPWGRSTTVLNTTLPDFNFTGLYRHSTSNLDLAVNRAYDPDLGRWLSRDPLENAEQAQGPNLFAYVRNSPTSRVDELGLQVTNSGDALGEAYGQAGDLINNSFVQEWAKAFADCEKIPHSPSRRCKCCVVSILVKVFGPYLEAKDGRGTVYDHPCSEVFLESITAPPWQDAIKKYPW